MIAYTPHPPYYAVIFSSVRTTNTDGYAEINALMNVLALQQKGFLGIENANSNIGITVSYWKELDDILQWKNNVEHTEARNRGREQWYKQYQLRICKVERAYGFEK